MVNTDSDWLLPRLSETTLALRAGKGANTVCSKWYVSTLTGYHSSGAVRAAPTQNQLGIWPWLYVLPVTGIVCMGSCVRPLAHASLSCPCRCRHAQAGGGAVSSTCEELGWKSALVKGPHGVPPVKGRTSPTRSATAHVASEGTTRGPNAKHNTSCDSQRAVKAAAN